MTLDLPLLHTLENVTFPGKIDEIRSFYRDAAPRFKIFIDDACAMPADWRTTWDRPLQWGLTGERNWATKYGAAGFIPHMIEKSPFVTADWREASASVVVLFARQYAGGPAIVQQQCLQRLASRSPAFQHTNGTNHFFIFTDSRGPCCLDGKYKDVEFLKHHIIGPHGEPDENWFFRRGRGPKIRCFDARKDVNIPTPNIHFPRTPYAPQLSTRTSTARPLLLFYAGWNYKVRMELVRLYRNDPDPDVMVRREVAPAEYIERILSAKFCPVCGGFSQWTPRLAEALYYECVPVIMSPQMLPPWSSILDWSTFSVRVEPTKRNLAALKATLRTLDHAKLLAGVRRAKAALTYHLDGWTGADMLPLLLFEMHRAAAAPIAAPPHVRLLENDIRTDRNYDVGMKNVHSQRAHDVFTRASVSVAAEVWECTSKDGYMCACKRVREAPMVEEQPFNVRKRFREARRGVAWRAAAHTPTPGASTGAARRLSASGEALSCPAANDLEQPEQLEAMLRSRASAEKDVVITILGPTSGMRAVRMGDLGQLMLRNMIARLQRLGIENYLAITTHLHLPSHPGNNLCLSVLRPAGVCCAYSGVGMPLVAEGAAGRRWDVTETHPYLLFLQRWWLTGQAVARGYNVLSLDTDMHLTISPLALVRQSPYDSFSALMQLDSAWPVEGRKEGQRSTDERGQHVNVVPCVAPPAGAEARAHGCPCGVTPAPMLNTGFVYVRATHGASAQQRLYNRSVELILQRLPQPPTMTTRAGKTEVDPRRVWAQDVVNEVATGWAALPAGWPPSCHLKDIACHPAARSPADAAVARRRWWLAAAPHSLWMASHAALQCRVAAGPPDAQLVAWTELHPPAQLLDGTPVGTATLAALPRAEVGRMCGKRQLIDARWLARAPPLTCAELMASPLRQNVLHMQFTNAETRVQILKAMHWWYLPNSSPPSSGAKACAALPATGGESASLAGVVVSSAMSNRSLLCVLPSSASEGQQGVAQGECPCCWDVSRLRRATLAAASKPESADLAALKALKQADKYSGCRIWRRFV